MLLHDTCNEVIEVIDGLLGYIVLATLIFGSALLFLSGFRYFRRVSRGCSYK